MSRDREDSGAKPRNRFSERPRNSPDAERQSAASRSRGEGQPRSRQSSFSAQQSNERQYLEERTDGHVEERPNREPEAAAQSSSLNQQRRYVKLTSVSLESVVSGLINSEQRDTCDTLLTTKGCRQYVKNVFGSTNWLSNVTSYYG